MDLAKLTPAPWVLKEDEDSGSVYIPDHSGYPMLIGEDDLPMCMAALEFVALARNAFDVMTRRGWHAYYDPGIGGWFLGGHHGCLNAFSQSVATCFPDPFTVLVEADRWYRQNVEKSAGPEQAS